MREFDDDGMPTYTELEKAQQEIQIKDGLLERKNEKIRALERAIESCREEKSVKDTEIKILKGLLLELFDRGSCESSY